jgi:DNA end-binding protein Ku
MDALRRSVEDARSGRSQKKTKSQSQVDDASKSELDTLARELKVRGRSRMNRAELLRAVKLEQRKAS